MKMFPDPVLRNWRVKKCRMPELPAEKLIECINWVSFLKSLSRNQVREPLATLT